jgi:CHAD domain-containing protein
VTIFLIRTDTGVPADLATDSVRAALEGSGVALDDRRAAKRTVLDTFDGRLNEAGLRLDLREGRPRELVLVGPSGSPPAHLVWDGAAPSLAADLPRGPFGARIASVIVERALVPVVEVTSTSRQAVRGDRRGKPIVTVVVHDDVRLASSPIEVMPSCVVEVVANVGHETDIDATIAPLLALGLERHDGDLVDAVLVAADRTLEGHTSSPTVPLERGDDALDAFRRVLRNLLAAINDNLPGTLADLDPEFLHDLRVAVRRTRSMLKEAKAVLPADIRDRYGAGFAELGAATGRTRDLDVYLLGWSDIVAPLGLDDPSVTTPLVDEIASRRQAAYAEMGEVLSSPATGELLGTWQAWLDDPDVGAGAGDGAAGPIGPYIAARIGKAQVGLLRDGRAIEPESPGERLHDLRKDAKKLRYLFECFAGLLPPKATKSFVSALKSLQDNLGQHQDAEVQVAELRELAHDLHARTGIDTDALLVVGRLIDHLERVRQRERDAFADRFAAYDTASNEKLLDTLLAKAATV